MYEFVPNGQARGGGGKEKKEKKKEQTIQSRTVNTNSNGKNKQE